MAQTLTDSGHALVNEALDADAPLTRRNLRTITLLSEQLEKVETICAKREMRHKGRTASLGPRPSGLSGFDFLGIGLMGLGLLGFAFLRCGLFGLGRSDNMIQRSIKRV